MRLMFCGDRLVGLVSGIVAFFLHMLVMEIWRCEFNEARGGNRGRNRRCDVSIDMSRELWKTKRFHVIRYTRDTGLD